MIISNIKDIEGQKRGNGVVRKVLVSPEHGWEGYVMRLFELEAGGHSSLETHPWPHIIYFTEGKGIVHYIGNDYEVEGGSFAYIPSDDLHQVKAAEDEKLSFVCIVPEEGHVK